MIIDRKSSLGRFFSLSSFQKKKKDAYPPLNIHRVWSAQFLASPNAMQRTPPGPTKDLVGGFKYLWFSPVGKIPILSIFFGLKPPTRKRGTAWVLGAQPTISRMKRWFTHVHPITLDLCAAQKKKRHSLGLEFSLLQTYADAELRKRLGWEDPDSIRGNGGKILPIEFGKRG